MWSETLSDSQSVLAQKLASSVAKQLQKSVEVNGKASLAVSGGKTPIEFFKALSLVQLDWSKITIILLDERWLDTNHEDSNEKLVRDYLLKNNAEKAYFLGLKNSAQLPSEGIMDCETQLRTQVQDLDVVVFGMGLDGHTASWFKGSKQLSHLMDAETSAWCLPVEDEFLPQARMSLTWRFVKRAKKMYLHFSGEDKNRIFAKACAERSEDLPISHILHQDGINISVYRTETDA